MNKIKTTKLIGNLLIISAITLLSSCGSRNAKVTSNVNKPIPMEHSNDNNWRNNEDAKFFGTVFVALF